MRLDYAWEIPYDKAGKWKDTIFPTGARKKDAAMTAAERNYGKIEKNKDIRKEAHVKPVETFLQNEKLKWFGHCLRRERNHICAKSLRLEVSGRRSRGRPKKRRRDNIKGDMKK